MFFLFFNIESYLFSKEPVEIRTHIHAHNLSEKHTQKNPRKHTHTRTHFKNMHTHAQT